MGRIRSATKLVTFGDSWPAGAELTDDEIPFGQLLANQLGIYNFVNRGESGSSIEHLIYNVEDYIESRTHSDDCIAIFFITGITRSIFFNDDHNPLTIEMGRRTLESDAYFTYIHSEDLGQLRFNTTISTLQKICKEQNIEDYYLIGWNDISLSFIGINETKFIEETASEMLGVTNALWDVENATMLRKDKTVFRHSHPNQRGHEIIANGIYEFLKKQDN